MAVGCVVQLVLHNLEKADGFRAVRVIIHAGGIQIEHLTIDSRTNYAREISALLRETYGSKIRVFATDIPHSVRAAEISAEGKSIFAHDPKGKVAEAYRALTKEVMRIEKQREKHQADLGR